MRKRKPTSPRQSHIHSSSVRSCCGSSSSRLIVSCSSSLPPLLCSSSCFYSCSSFFFLGSLGFFLLKTFLARACSFLNFASMSSTLKAGSSSGLRAAYASTFSSSHCLVSSTFSSKSDCSCSVTHGIFSLISIALVLVSLSSSMYFGTASSRSLACCLRFL